VFVLPLDSSTSGLLVRGDDGQGPTGGDRAAIGVGGETVRGGGAGGDTVDWLQQVCQRCFSFHSARSYLPYLASRAAAVWRGVRLRQAENGGPSTDRGGAAEDCVVVLSCLDSPGRQVQGTAEVARQLTDWVLDEREETL
jgi:hypothetical protein